MTEEQVVKMAQEIWIIAAASAEGLGSIPKDERKDYMKEAVEVVFEIAEAFAEVEEGRKNK